MTGARSLDSKPFELEPRSDDSSTIDSTSSDHAREQLVEIPTQELTDLRRKLESQVAIERAKGILMGHYRLDPDRAFAVLVRWSQNSNVKVRTIAEQLARAVEGRPTSRHPPHELAQQAMKAPQLGQATPHR